MVKFEIIKEIRGRFHISGGTILAKSKKDAEDSLILLGINFEYVTKILFEIKFDI